MNYKIFSKNELESKILDKFKVLNASDNPDYIFTFGGDGTFLKAARLNMDKANIFNKELSYIKNNRIMESAKKWYENSETEVFRYRKMMKAKYFKVSFFNIKEHSLFV